MPTARGVWRKGTTELRLLLSRDAGKSWQHLGGKEAWLPYHSDDNGYDQLVFSGSPVRVGDELWLSICLWERGETRLALQPGRAPVSTSGCRPRSWRSRLFRGTSGRGPRRCWGAEHGPKDLP